MLGVIEKGQFPEIQGFKDSDQLTVALDPLMRRRSLEFMNWRDGLAGVVEDPYAAYCPMSLTQTPEAIKPFLAARQAVTIDILSRAGIRAYNPGTAPYSPDLDLTTLPNAVYAVDSAKVRSARYFVGHHLLGSSGFGTEAQEAIEFLRVPVILTDKHIRISRMQPHRTIYLQYENFERQADRFVEVFRLLTQYEPGIGFNGHLPVLLGFGARGEMVDLEETVYTNFPDLEYHYDGTVPILKLRVENPELFYETQN